MTQVNTRSMIVVPSTTASTVPALVANQFRKMLQVINGGAQGTVRIKFDQPFMTPANEVQTISFPIVPNAGTWTVKDWAGNSTGDLAANISAGDLQTALEALAAIGAGNVTVAGTVAAGFTVTYKGALALTAIPGPLTFTSSLTDTTGQLSTIQHLVFSKEPTAGTFTVTDSLGNESADIAFDADEAAILAAINALPAVNGSVSAVAKGATTISVTFGNAPLQYQLVALLGSASELTNDDDLADEVQLLTIAPQPLQGTFKLNLEGDDSVALVYNASAAQIQAALETLCGAGTVSVAGFKLADGFTITFHGASGDRSWKLLTVQAAESLHPDVNQDPQLRTGAEISFFVQRLAAGAGPVDVTISTEYAQEGVAPASVTPVLVVTVPGVPQLVEGVPVVAGEDKLYDYAVPIGAVYLMSDTANVPVTVIEG